MSRLTGWRIRGACPLLLTTWLFGMIPLGSHAQPSVKKAADSTLKADELSRIKQATKPDELVLLARDFINEDAEVAARTCIDRACKADPSLLQDEKRDPDRRWNSFWFGYRATLRERQLNLKDAAGRVRIAEWLYRKGHEREAAENMLRTALRIDKSLPEAVKLAEQWALVEEQSFRFDLTYALGHSLFPGMTNDKNTPPIELKDQGVPLEPRRGSEFMLLPFFYDLKDPQLRVDVTAARVKSNDGKPCRSLGIFLFVSNNPGTGTGPVSVATNPLLLSADLKLDENNSVLWEQIKGQRETRPGRESMDECFINKIRPRGGSSSGQDLPGEGGTRRSRTGRRSEAPSPGTEAQPTNITGYAAFLLEVPEAMESVQIVFRSDPPFTLTRSFLDALAKPVVGRPSREVESLANAMREKMREEQSCIAAAAIWKLAQIRDGFTSASLGQPGQGAADSNAPKAPLRTGDKAQKVDALLLEAMVHPNAMVRREACMALVSPATQFNPISLKGLWEDKDKDKKMAIAMRLLDYVEDALIEGSVGHVEGGSNQPSPQVNPSGDNKPTGLFGLPASTASANVFVLLGAGVNSPIPEVRQRALDLLVENASQQSVAALEGTGKDARSGIAERMVKVTDSELKAALLRVIMADPSLEEATLVKVLDACADLKLKIAATGDPVVQALVSHKLRSSKIKAKLLRLVSQADLSLVADQEEFPKIINSLAADSGSDPDMKKALLDMSSKQLRLPYEAPVSMDQGGTSGPGEKWVMAEKVMANLATSPKTDFEIALQAATTLVETGRISRLSEQLKQLGASSERYKKLIEELVKKESLQGHEALPILLARQLSGGTDSKLAKPVLKAIDGLYRKSGAREQWKLDLPIKMAMDSKELVMLTLDADKDVSRYAETLLRGLGKMTDSELGQLKSVGDANGRQGKLDELNAQRAARVAGRYHCLMYLDLKPAETNPSAAGQATPPGMTAEQSSVEGAIPAERLMPLKNVPLPEVIIEVKAAGSQGFSIVCDEEDLSAAEEGQAGSGTPQPGTLRLNAVRLLQMVLNKADDQGNPLISQVDRIPLLNGSATAELRHKQMGTWVLNGDITIPVSSGSQLKSESPLKLERLKIFLEYADAGGAKAPAIKGQSEGRNK